jgi:putative ABC transport system permease protein
MPGPEDTDGALVTEYLLYQMGIVDEEEQTRLLGQPITFEVRPDARPAPAMLLSLLTGSSSRVGTGQEKVLGKVLERLPDSLDRLGLSPNEQKVMREMLKSLQTKPVTHSSIQSTFHIKGILRLATGQEERRRDAWILRHTGVLLSPSAAEAFFLRLPHGKENGYNSAAIEVDEMDHVKEVQAELQKRGFNANSAVEVIEREQFVYLTVFTTMSVVALVALMVSAIGITNTMLMSVLERFREIGICKATGARDGHVLALFLMEGALVGLVGGTTGSGAGASGGDSF